MKKSFTKKLPLFIVVLLFCSIIAFALQNGDKMYIYRQGKIKTTIANSQFDSAKVENASLNVYKANQVIYNSAMSEIDSITFEDPANPVEIYVENPSFEIGATGTKTYEFNNVPGWNWGNPQYLSNVPSPQQDKHGSYLLNKDQGGWTHFTTDGLNSVDGNYVLLMSAYSRQVWQQLQEIIQSNTSYTVSLNAGMNQWVSSMSDISYYVRIQLGFFNGEAGDLNNMTILKEERIPLTAENKGKLTEKTMVYKTSGNSPYAGKNLVITLSGYKKQDPFANYEVKEWEDNNNVSQYFFDNVKVTKTKAIAEARTQPFYRGAMMTFAHFMMEHGGIKYYENGQEKDPYQSLKDHGANMVRLAVTVDDRNITAEQVNYKIDHSSWENVKKQLLHCKNIGLEVFLTFQLASDNGGAIPTSWKAKNLSSDQLAKQVYDFVYEKLDWMGQNNCIPAIIAIGNETNIDFCWDTKYRDAALANQLSAQGIDHGDRRTHGAKMMNKGYDAIDAINAKYGAKAKKLLHLHVIGSAPWALDMWIAVGLTNFDIAGLSWYANEASSNHMYGWPSFSAYIKNQWQRHQKEFLMVEVAHPFVVGDFDGKGNLAPFVQPGFPPTPIGQRRYMETICEDVADGGGLGVIYWGGEWVGNDMYVYHDFKNSTWEDKAFWTSEKNSKIHELHEGIDWMKRDYDGVFKVHLFALADEMQEMHGKAAEGAAEGQYQTGAKAAFQEVIDRGMALYNDAGSTQDWVDVTHKLMLDAITAFEDRMNPFVSEMTALITSSKALLNQTNVGAGAGMIPAQTDKNELSAAITQAEQFMQSTANITQRLLAAEAERLEKAVSAFKGKIPGVYEVDVVNPSFEPDITDTNANGNYLFKDFDHIPGWNTAGLIQGLAPWDEGQYNCLVLKGGSQLTNFSNVDGDHVMQLHEFNLPIWQQLQERVKSNTRYTVTVNAGMWDSQPQDHNYVRVQLVVFNGKVGDLENITVLKEQQFTNISYAGLQELKMEYDTPATPEHLGKRMALTFCGYYWSVKKTTFNVNWNGPNNQTYFIDLVKMTREKK